MKKSFKQMSDTMQTRFSQLAKDAKYLYTTDTGEQLWDAYLASFAPEDNPVYRERTEHDCSCCRHFIKRYGGLVIIDAEYNRHTLWEFNGGDNFQPSIDAMHNIVSSAPIVGVLVSEDRAYGEASSLEIKDGNVKDWNHFALNIPAHLIYTGAREKKASVAAKHVETHDMFTRGLRDLRPHAIQAVLDMINANSLYRGREFKSLITTFQSLQNQWMALDESKRDNLVWASIREQVVTRLHSTSIGQLILDLSNETETEEALRMYMSRMDASRYQVSAIKPVTESMANQARRAIEERGLMASLPRKFASVDEISVNDIVWVNRRTREKMRDPFAELVTAKPTIRLNGTKISIEDFYATVLPSASNVEIYFAPELRKNLMSIVAPVNKDAPSLFKWNNNFSWAYTGNLASSSTMKENVKNAGGKIDGDLRFSIQWDGQHDYDAHCEINGGQHEKHIYYGNKRPAGVGGGNLDVDIISPRPNIPSVENITFPTKGKLPIGKYDLYVRCFSHHGTVHGFTAEVEFDGKIHYFSYDKNIPSGRDVHVAVINVSADRRISITPLLQMSTTAPTSSAWGLDVNKWYPVNIVTESPNYWGDNAVSQLHHMFVVEGCHSTETPNAFYIEHLEPELREYRTTLQSLAGNMPIYPADGEEVSGFGFSFNAEIPLKVDGVNYIVTV